MLVGTDAAARGFCFVDADLVVVGSGGSSHKNTSSRRKRQWQCCSSSSLAVAVAIETIERRSKKQQ